MYIDICMYIYINIYIEREINIDMDIDIYIYTYIHMYIYMYMYVYMLCYILLAHNLIVWVHNLQVHTMDTATRKVHIQPFSDTKRFRKTMEDHR